MTIFGTQGIRDAMINSYHRHIAKLRGQPLSGGASLHEVGLYGALATRYMVRLQPVLEVVIWAELAPFIKLNPNNGLTALAEYVVYKETPLNAKRTGYQIKSRRDFHFLVAKNVRQLRLWQR